MPEGKERLSGEGGLLTSPSPSPGYPRGALSKLLLVLVLGSDRLGIGRHRRRGAPVPQVVPRAQLIKVLPLLPSQIQPQRDLTSSVLGHILRSPA
jgi:hypothetical protein